ncbi:exosome complex component MTR3 [Cimex lectularius]|uniref:Uncharacterized protein n=1 Tax=Cimex lectularius TaxID=79782 RepID=A0A8I6S4D5_CIMLE|nr:exosome complex component MTR3 [Cimex lectularius]
MIDIEEMIREIKRKDKEESKSLNDFLPLEKRYKSYTQQREEVFKDKERRKDGRKDNDHRKIFIQLGTVSDARGSCYVELGDTKVILSIRGPKEIPNIQEYTELCALECLVEYAPFVKKPTSDEGFMAEALRLALEPVLCRHEFPNLQITVSAFIIEDGGSALAAAITAASLAMTQARLPTFGVVTAVTVGIHNNRVIVDPSKLEEDFCSNPYDAKSVKNFGLITIAYMNDLKQITLYQMNGTAKPSLLDQVLQGMLNRCQELHKLCAQHLMRELKLSAKHIIDTAQARAAVETLNLNG